jgi:hypothetical protein
MISNGSIFHGPKYEQQPLLELEIAVVGLVVDVLCLFYVWQI